MAADTNQQSWMVCKPKIVSDRYHRRDPSSWLAQCLFKILFKILFKRLESRLSIASFDWSTWSAWSFEIQKKKINDDCLVAGELVERAAGEYAESKGTEIQLLNAVQKRFKAVDSFSRPSTSDW